MSETLDRIQKIYYDMFGEFDHICRKYNIEYFLIFGSLIGALRHKGMIPWDNDIDVIMKREEWKKLKQHKDEFSDPYFWLECDYYGEKKHYDCVDRIVYKDAYIKLDKDFCSYYDNMANSIHLDLFIIDRTHNDIRGGIQRFELKVIYGLLNSYRFNKYIYDKYDLKMKIVNKAAVLLGRLFSAGWLRQRAKRVSGRFSEDRNAKSFFVSNGTYIAIKWTFPARLFEKAYDAQFGELIAEIPVGADEINRIVYGDYMKLPPEEDRKLHILYEDITEDAYVFEAPYRG